MGYYTDYALKVLDHSVQVQAQTCEHAVPPNAKYCPECGLDLRKTKPSVSEIIDEICEDYDSTLRDVFHDTAYWKWYDHEKDLRALSNVFPGWLFILSGKGEENGDIWKKYFLNGKCQVAQAKIVIDEFDENKLA